MIGCMCKKIIAIVHIICNADFQGYAYWWRCYW